jgi:hypothetical protein
MRSSTEEREPEPERDRVAGPLRSTFSNYRTVGPVIARTIRLNDLIFT